MSACREADKTIGRYVKVLEALLQANPRDDAFTDRIHWL